MKKYQEQYNQITARSWEKKKKQKQATRQNIKKRTHSVKEKGSGEHSDQLCDP